MTSTFYFDGDSFGSDDDTKDTYSASEEYIIRGGGCDTTLGAYHVSVLWYLDPDTDGQGYVPNSDDYHDSEAPQKYGGSELCDGQINDGQTTSLPSDESDDGDGYVERNIGG